MVASALSGASSSLGREGANGIDCLELHRREHYVLGTMQLWTMRSDEDDDDDNNKVRDARVREGA